MLQCAPLWGLAWREAGPFGSTGGVPRIHKPGCADPRWQSYMRSWGTQKRRGRYSREVNATILKLLNTEDRSRCSLPSLLITETKEFESVSSRRVFLLRFPPERSCCVHWILPTICLRNILVPRAQLTTFEDIDGQPTGPKFDSCLGSRSVSISKSGHVWLTAPRAFLGKLTRMKGMALSRENGEQTEGAEARRYRAGFSRSPSWHAFLVNWAFNGLAPR